MKRFRLTPLLTAAFLLAVAVYISYQVIANLTQQIQTVDALEVTVEDKIPARGYFIREQITVPGGSGSSFTGLFTQGCSPPMGSLINCTGTSSS